MMTRYKVRWSIQLTTVNRTVRGTMTVTAEDRFIALQAVLDKVRGEYYHPFGAVRVTVSFVDCGRGVTA